MKTLSITEAVYGSFATDQTKVNASRLPKYAFDQLNYDLLKRLTEEYGLDAATVILFNAIGNDPENAKFLAELAKATDALEEGQQPAFSEQTRLVVIPGAFHAEHPTMGSGGEAFLTIANEWGIKAERVPLKSLGGVQQNKEIVRDFFSRRTGVDDIVVSISKGGYEFSRSVEEAPDVFPTVKHWINVAGLLRGSLAANQIMSSWWQKQLLLAYLKLRKGKGDALRQLVWRGPGAAAAPKGAAVINCIGIPQAFHTSGTIGRRHADLGHHGPNDGATLILDTIIRPGYIVPLWGADHYFRTFGRVEKLVRAILLYIHKKSLPA